MTPDRRTRYLARRRHPPRGSCDVRRAGDAARRCRGRSGCGSAPADSSSAWVATGFDVLASRVVGGPGAAGRPERRRRRARARAHRDGPQRLCRPGVPDGLRVARGAAARHGLRRISTMCRRGPCWTWRSAASRWPRNTQRAWAARVAAGPGGGRCQLRRCQRRHPDALRIRLDRNGFPAAVVGGRGPGMGLDPETVAADEIVRVRALPAWLRIDARFGSVYRRRGDPALVLR